MTQNSLTTEVLVVGGGTGGTAAALQCARKGVKTLLISEFDWLGGMLTSAGVAAPDGNELAAFQTGMWGAFLQELQHRQPSGLDHSWVSFFSFDPRVGAQIFGDWVQALPNLSWIRGQVPLEVYRDGDRIIGVRFSDFTVNAQITIDATELGDLLALGQIPHRWGWEFQAEFNEPSAPIAANELTKRYPVQAPTWVVLMQDFGAGETAPEIPIPPDYNPEQFQGAWQNYGAEQFLNYGRLPGGLFMINWPIQGNDYGEGIGRLLESESARSQFLNEAYWHSQGFAYFIQSQLGRRYGLASSVFPSPRTPISAQIQFPSAAFALHPYYRESRRLRGLTTVTETDILPVAGGQVAALPFDQQGRVSAIALGNYPNDHHYPNFDFPLKPKSIRWGGRWTGTPFTIPYGAVVPETGDGFLACEKNFSVSHIANGATRLQPVVMNVGQAVGMAAALCVQQGIQPRLLNVRDLQAALLTDAIAPSAVIPLFNLTPDHPDWLNQQREYCDRPETYPLDGYSPHKAKVPTIENLTCVSGIFQRHPIQDYCLQVTQPPEFAGQTWKLVTLHAEIDRQFQAYPNAQVIVIKGQINASGNWIRVTEISQPTS